MKISGDSRRMVGRGKQVLGLRLMEMLALASCSLLPLACSCLLLALACSCFLCGRIHRCYA